MTDSRDTYQPRPTFVPAVNQPAPAEPSRGSAEDRQLLASSHRTDLTAAQKFWYVIGNIPFGAAYFTKVPAKKAMADFGLAELTGAEAFWYILMCIPFGAGYFAKLSTSKALSELQQFRVAQHTQLTHV
jgi:hypothetical protein